ncbi:WD40/YVTN/BNR-like repeat-containing protein [Cyclonatronum proteinivorum]|nr:YCF48-related protein [Cyclonatronum proteinivorum]
MKFFVTMLMSFAVTALIGAGFSAQSQLQAQQQSSGIFIFPQDDDNGPQPIRPPKPQLSAVVGDGSVLLYWDDAAEFHYDPFFDGYVVYQRPVATGVFEDVFANPNNFQGYMVFRSTDPEFTDALRITDNQGNRQRLAFEDVFDLQNDITGYHPASVGGQRIWMGSDTGIRRIWEDSGLTNGRTYYYAVVSFTHGDALPEFELPIEFDEDDVPIIPLPNSIYTIPPLDSGLDIEILPDGTVITGVNVVAVTPQRGAAGFVAPQDPMVQQISGSGSGTIDVQVIDPDALRGGHNYSIAFTDTLIERPGNVVDLVTKSVSLTNTTTGEVLFDRLENFQGVELPVKEGLLFFIDDIPNRVAVDEERTEWITEQESNIHNFVIGVSGRNPTPSDYRFEFFDEPVRESLPFTIGNTNIPAERTNVIITNTVTGQEVDYAFFTNPQLPRDLRDVVYLSSDNILIFGAAGLIQRSEDGGEIWTNVESGVSVRLKAAHFVDAQNGWAAGREGTVTRTTDGGQTWTPMETGITSILRDIYFVDEQNGWAVGDGGVIIATTNGGDSWVTQDSGVLNRFNNVVFTDAQTGYVSGLIFGAGNSRVLKTTDGGTNWEPLPVGPILEFFGMDFTDEQTGYVAGTGGRIFKTEDAGETWTELDTPTNQQLNDITFADNATGWSVGRGGAIIFTADGGQTWEALDSGTGVELFGIGSIAGGTSSLVAVGANSTRLRSSNQGQTWQATEDFRRFRAAFDNNNQSRSDILYILEDVRDDGELRDTWRVSMLARTATSPFGLTVDPSEGDELRFFTVKPLTSADEFTFTIDGSNFPDVDLSEVEDPLSLIRVVPNPYLVTHVAEPRTGGRQLHFTNLPQQATIRIFSVSGRLLQTLRVDNPATESRYVWDMITSENRELSYGVYIYHVDAPGIGEKVGKFAVIK